MTPKRTTTACLLLLLSLLLPRTAPANEPPPPDGEVKVPLSAYTALVGRASFDPRTATVPYALSPARVHVAVRPPEMTAEVRAELTVTVLGEGRAVIQLLPAGTVVTHAQAQGQPMALTVTSEGLAWIVEGKGSHTLSLAYTVDALRAERGYALAVPAPRAPSLELDAVIPGAGVEVTVVPSVGLRRVPQGDAVRIDAKVPATSAVQITWQTGAARGHALSRARYQGELHGDVLRWKATMEVELFDEAARTVAVFPRGVTLSGLEVDAKSAPVLVEGESFATVIAGRGRHQVTLAFESRVEREGGPPRVALGVPEVPVSAFELLLPGRKELSVSPEASITVETLKDATRTVVHVPMTGEVAFSWVEAAPEAGPEEKSSVNAAIYQALEAHEGVLSGRAHAVYEVTRGESNVLDLVVPQGVLVSRIVIPQGQAELVDWKTEPDGLTRIYLDRKVKGEVLLDVTYERLLEAGQVKVGAPLLSAAGVHRQRGMVALLATAELALKPVGEPKAAKVGENQLPADFRAALTATVAHTYRYVDAPPELTLEVAAAERVPGRFDSEVDTLVSVGEVALRAQASVQVHVKTGSLTGLALDLPAGVSLLGLTGPSIRSHTVSADGGAQVITVEFTQAMEGDFTLELGYERIFTEGQGSLAVPAVSVRASEVEHGRLAVEALAAVEVKAAEAAHLSAVDVAELPRALVLRTTSPILLAYKYAQRSPAPRLTISIARHTEVEVQVATIDQARYRTLFTEDGLAVTVAELLVRNRKKQFLSLELPAGSEVWSALVDGQPEKPALGGSDGGKVEDAAGSATRPITVLVRLLSSAEPFPVEVVYATRLPRMGSFGTLEGVLPRPDLLVTHTRVDVFLPVGPRYLEPTGNLEPLTVGEAVAADAIQASLEHARKASADGARPLAISVPARGVHYAFEKLYADRVEGGARFRIRYVSGWVDKGVTLASAAAVALFWAVLAAAALGRLPHQALRDRRARTALLALLGAVALLPMLALGGGPWPAALLALPLAGLAVLAVARRLRPRPESPELVQG